MIFLRLPVEKYQCGILFLLDFLISHYIPIIFPLYLHYISMSFFIPMMFPLDSHDLPLVFPL